MVVNIVKNCIKLLLIVNIFMLSEIYIRKIRPCRNVGDKIRLKNWQKNNNITIFI